MRLIICGGVCVGKTLFSNWLGAIHELPVIHLDDLYWYGNWNHISRTELIERVENILQGKKEWIIEGNYPEVMNIFVDENTSIIYMDIGLICGIYRVIKRSFDPERKGVPVNVKGGGNIKEPFCELLVCFMKSQMKKKKVLKTFAMKEDIFLIRQSRKFGEMHIKIKLLSNKH